MTKTHDRLLSDAMRAYNEVSKEKEDWELNARMWHGRAIKAEFITAMVPFAFLLIIVSLMVIAYLWSVSTVSI